jgi:predicted nuclease of predicted toxin-antitoxin system
VRLFIDECLSPLLARRLNATGEHDAIHPLDVGRRGEPDYKVLERCLAEDRVIVTENARDFRRLRGKVELHPGLILLPAIDREGTWQLLLRVIESLSARGDPMRLMVNKIAEIGSSGAITLSALTAGDE